MRMIDADVLLDVISRHSYMIRNGVGFYDVNYGMTMDGIRQCVEETPTIDEWISVKDRLPEEGKQVLVWKDYFPPGYMTVPEVSHRGYCIDLVYNKSWVSTEYPLMWMELPEPPKE